MNEENKQDSITDIKEDIKFENLADVLKYLKESGWSIARSSLYRHNKEGKLLPEKSGAYKQKAVDRYARLFLNQCVTGKRTKQANKDIQYSILKQQIKLSAIKIARLERLNALEEEQYFPADEVRAAAIAKARVVREEIMKIAGRVGVRLAAETDENKCREILNQEINQTLVYLSKQVIFQ
ncbi:MAG: hypothetical protein WBN66_07275 [Smithella sp.]